eukprot:2465813-Amphidinium_carterae.2
MPVSGIEGASTIQALRNILSKKGTRGDKERVLLQFLEYATNITIETGIPKECRSAAKLKEMVLPASEAHTVLVVPTDLNKQGVYEYSLQDGRLSLRNKFSTKEAVLTPVTFKLNSTLAATTVSSVHASTSSEAFSVNRARSCSRRSLQRNARKWMPSAAPKREASEEGFIGVA